MHFQSAPKENVSARARIIAAGDDCLFFVLLLLLVDFVSHEPYSARYIVVDWAIGIKICIYKLCVIYW